MRFEREKWTPLTIVIETKEEAEILHKILGLTDYSEIVGDADLYGLFMKLGEGLAGTGRFEAQGEIAVFEA